MPRKSSIEINPRSPYQLPKTSTNFTPFPIFHPIREQQGPQPSSISRRLTRDGINVNEDHVIHVHHNGHTNGYPVNDDHDHEDDPEHEDPYHRDDELDRRFTHVSHNFYENEAFDSYGPRFSRITLSSTVPYNNSSNKCCTTNTCCRHETSPLSADETTSASHNYSCLKNSTRRSTTHHQYIDNNEHRGVGSCRNSSPITTTSSNGIIVPRVSKDRPSSVYDEMNHGVGFKKPWSRKLSPETLTNQIYGTPIWSRRDQVKSSPVHSILEPTSNVTILSHSRRLSYGPHQNTNAKRRRSSVLNTIFGESGNRRFSEDLRRKRGTASSTSETEDDELPDESSETAKVIFFQVFIPFLIAGFGNVGAGLILDFVQHWPVFQHTPELFILVASFLGFKGNLEMTLAARLATQANLGQLDTWKEQLDVGCGNVALIQAQATVVAFLAAVIAILINYLKELTFDLHSCLLILQTSLVTASITGLFLSLLMVVVTVFSRKVGVNPDNVSTLLAAFLGDISAVILLSGSAKLFYDYRHVVFLPPVIISFFFVVLPIFLVIARRNRYTHDVVFTGWIPIIIAMFISSVGGLIFDFAVETFQTIAVFQPIINGVGANLVAVQASRISTYLHQRVELGSLPIDEENGQKYKICQSPIAAFFGKNPNVRTARLLLLMSIPGHVIYVVTIRVIESGQVYITVPFMSFYLIVAIVQVTILLYLAHLIVPFLWSRRIDPDNAAIPGIMSCGDLLGTAFLTAAYFVLEQMNDPNTENYMMHNITSIHEL